LLERAAEAPATPAPALDRTMLAEVAAPIRYQCPRCQKSLEDPPSEAGNRKPCPGCGGRLKVPEAVAAPTAPSLNKTLLATSEAALTAAPPAPMSRGRGAASADDPIGPPPFTSSWTEHVAKIALVLVLIVGLAAIGMVYSWKSSAEREQQQALAAQQEAMEQMKREVDRRAAMFQQQQANEERRIKEREEAQARQDQRQREMDKEKREFEARRLALLENNRSAADLEALLAEKDRELALTRKQAEEQKLSADKEMRDLKDQLEALKAQIDALKKPAAAMRTRK
jgi:DNA-directed RNA polymerase subunit RPC12/RpoP